MQVKMKLGILKRLGIGCVDPAANYPRVLMMSQVATRKPRLSGCGGVGSRYSRAYVDNLYWGDWRAGTRYSRAAARMVAVSRRRFFERGRGLSLCCRRWKVESEAGVVCRAKGKKNKGPPPGV